MYVYFIQAGKKGAIKVGITNNVEKRIETLQIGNPYELRVLSLIPCESRAHAFEIERRIHKFFRRQNIRGEWFTGNIDLKKMNERFGSYDYRYHSNPKQQEEHDCSALKSIPENF
jgi:predicted GIY-YIG superfamily endonuclease